MATDSGSIDSSVNSMTPIVEATGEERMSPTRNVCFTT